MSPLLRVVVLGLVSIVVSRAEAQNGTNAKPMADFSDDPCGNPLIESQLWESVEGRIVSVEDGSTLLLAATKDHRRLRVHVVGVAVAQQGPLSDQARGQVTEMVLNKRVRVWVNPSDWGFLKRKPVEVTGVVHLQVGAETDVGLSLLTKGLARTEEPHPYKISRYTFCKYREAEREAKSNKLGIWQ
jgi:endonuclease YncB( thermonuclease family)